MIELRICGVPKSQLDPRPDLISQRGPDLGPARGRHRDMHAIGQPLGGERRDLGFRRVEFTLQAQPPVDNQKDIAEPVAQWVPLRLELSVVLNRFDAVLAKQHFA
jgi:hypothetical protein